MANLAAVVGIGQTNYMTKRGDVSIAGLVREAAVNALQDAVCRLTATRKMIKPRALPNIVKMSFQNIHPVKLSGSERMRVA